MRTGVHLVAIRGAVALLAAVFFVAVSYYGYYWEGYTPVDPPGGRNFWTGPAVFIAVIVAVGLLVARWCVLGVAVMYGVADVGWALFGRPGDFDGYQPPPRETVETFAGVAMLAVMLAIGVGVAKLGKVAASRIREAPLPEN